MLELKEHEESFPVKTVGVRYICEHCNEGEMIVNLDVRLIVEYELQKGPVMIPHTCSKCKKEMLLPRSYPRVEFIPIEEVKTEVYPKREFIWTEFCTEAIREAIQYDQISHDFFLKAFPMMSNMDNFRLIRKLKEVGFIRDDESRSYFHVTRWNYNDIPVDVLEELHIAGYSEKDIKDMLKRRDMSCK